MRADEALRDAHTDLEQRVSERTTDLAAANVALQSEMAERGRAQAARDEVARRLVIAEEHERKRVSRELHDQMGQQLTGLMLGLQALKDMSGERAEWLQAIENLQSIADQIGREVHQLALDLRPPALDDLGLAAALANYTNEWVQRSQVEASFHSHGLEERRPPSEVETAIYRVVLEALNNVARHAHAAQVSVIVEWQDAQLTAIVEDDGQGFDTEAALSTIRSQQRLGLLGMQERMTQVGGSLTIESTPGSGTTIIARVPLRQKPEGPADG
jgi:signal transduction histidine kinase